MHVSLLQGVGRSLHGERWQSPLARDLGVSDRTMRYWAAGKYEPPDNVWRELLELVWDRRDLLIDITAALYTRIGGEDGKPKGPAESG